MANNNVVEQSSTLSAFERNSYFYGKLLTTRDFELEQQYGIEKNRLINRLVLGDGIISGLQVQDVQLGQVGKNTLTMTLTKGVALDCLGREIVVSDNKFQSLEVKSRGKNYIYITYNEQNNEPVGNSGNGFSSPQNFDYNRVQETYSISLSPDPPFAYQITGKVTAKTNADSQPIAGAKVEALDVQTNIVKAATLTDNTGNYTLSVSNGTYQIRASASGFKTQTLTNSIDKESKDINLTLEKASSADDTSVVQTKKSSSISPTSSTDETSVDQAQKYYNDRLQVYSESSNPKILLAVVDIPEKSGKAQLNTQETEQYRKIVYGNQMLYNLLREISSATPAATSGNQGRIFTGIAELEFDKKVDAALNGTLVPVTITVNELGEQEPFSVILAPIGSGQKQKAGINFTFGSNPQIPRSYTACVAQPYNKTFEISGFDPNLFTQNQNQKVKVVYWVFAGAQMVNVPATA